MTPSNFNIGDLAVIVANSDSRVDPCGGPYVGETVTILSPVEEWSFPLGVCVGHRVRHADGTELIVTPCHLRKIPPDGGQRKLEAEQRTSEYKQKIAAGFKAIREVIAAGIPK